MGERSFIDIAVARFVERHIVGAHRLFVKLRPRAVLLARTEPLHSHAVDGFLDAVDPAETQRFLNRVNIIKAVRLNRSAALDSYPAFAFFRRMERQPFSELFTAGNCQNIEFSHQTFTPL